MSYADIIIALSFGSDLDLVQGWLNDAAHDAYSVQPLPYRVTSC